MPDSATSFGIDAAAGHGAGRDSLPVSALALVAALEDVLSVTQPLSFELVNASLSASTSHAEIAARCTDMFADLPAGSTTLRRRLHSWATELLAQLLVPGSADEAALLPRLARHLECAGEPHGAHRRWCELLSILATEGRGEQWDSVRGYAVECWDLWCAIQGGDRRSPWLAAADARRERLLGDAGEAVRRSREAVELLEQAGDLRACVTAQVNLTSALERAGQADAAQQSRQKAMTRATEIGDESLRAMALHSFALVGPAEGAAAAPHLSYNEQVELLEEIVAIRQRTGDLRGLSLVLNNLAVLHGQSGQPLGAMDALERSLAIRQRLGDRRGEAMNLLNLATLQNELGEHSSALESGMVALARFRDISDRFGEGLSLTCSGHAQAALGQLQEAQHLFGEAAAINRTCGYLPELGVVLQAMAEVRWQLGQHGDAAQLAIEARPLLAEGGRRLEQARACTVLATWYTDSGKPELARDMADEAAALRRHLDSAAESGLDALLKQLTPRRQPVPVESCSIVW